MRWIISKLLTSVALCMYCICTRSCWFLGRLICTSQTPIDLHYFNMKITTTWIFSHGSSAQRLVTALYGSLFSLPTLNCGSGTSRFANHNTVGTAFALPSLHANAASRLSSLFFPPSSVYFGCPLLFPSGNFEVDRCCLFRGERFQSTKAMVGWGTGGGLKRDAGESSTLRELQDSSHVFFISAGVWSQMERGQSWLRRLYPTHKYCTHTHTKEKDEHALPAIPPSTTSTDYKPTQSRGLYFPRPRCQFGLITLPRFGLWQYEKTQRFKGITNPWTYTYCSLKSSGGGNWEHVFFFQEQLQRGCLPCSRANNAAGEEEESFTHGAPIQPPNTVSNLHD